MVKKKVTKKVIKKTAETGFGTVSTMKEIEGLIDRITRLEWRVDRLVDAVDSSKRVKGI